MVKKTGIGLSLTLVLTMLLIFLSSSSVKSPCACVSVNDDVIRKLNDLDSFVKEYSENHNGVYPTFEEFRSFASKSINRNYTASKFTNDVDIQKRRFNFNPTEKDHYVYVNNVKKHVRIIGYNVSQDGKSYVLLGTGINEIRPFKFGSFSKYYTYPTLYPYQKPIGHSPFM